MPTEFIPGEKIGRSKQPDRYEQSPLSKFSGTEVEPNLDHFHPFGSPVYVLENDLQSHHAHNKWSDRSRVGIFLCHSPNHASNVPLVLNTQTGLVSPQFHCIYDNEFDTCKRDAKFISLWQYKAKLHTNPYKSGVTRIDVSPTVDPSQSNFDAPLPDAINTIPRHLSTPWDLPAPQPNDHPPDETEESPPPAPADTEPAVPQHDDQTAPPTQIQTRYGRIVKPPNRLIENMVLAATYISLPSPRYLLTTAYTNSYSLTQKHIPNLIHSPLSLSKSLHSSVQIRIQCT